MTKEARIYGGEKPISSTSGAGETVPATCKRKELEHSLTPYAKINPKWIKDLNVKPDTIKLVKVNIGRDIHHSNNIFFFWISLLKQKKEKQKQTNVT